MRVCAAGLAQGGCQASSVRAAAFADSMFRGPAARKLLQHPADEASPCAEDAFAELRGTLRLQAFGCDERCHTFVDLLESVRHRP
jgi:hypothetical protein